MEYLHLSIEQLHSLLVNKEVTPLDLTLEAIAKAKADNNNAFEYIMENEAIEIAKSLGEPEPHNLFWGIPFAIKDNFSTKDVPSTGSSDSLKDYVPIYNSEVYQRLINAKAIPIGKTTLDELAMGGSGTTGHLGKTFNPWDPSHTRHVGGSSCGSAAVTSAGIVPFAIGSDTGDSVRKPASYAGLVGLKPTWGRISRYGLFPFATSMDHVAYFTRNVNDSASLLSLLAGRDNKDASSSFEKVDNYISAIDESIKGKKIAVIKEIVDFMFDEDLKHRFEESLQYFKDEGAEVTYVSMDKSLLHAIYPTYIILSCAEATSNNACIDGVKYGVRKEGDTYQEIMINSRTSGFSNLIRRRFVIGSFSLLKANQKELFLRGQKARRKIVDAYNDILKDYDAIYVPASPTVAPKFGEKVGDNTSGDFLAIDNHLGIANFAGLPSVTLPIGFKEGLPFGANLTAKPFEEAKLLNIAKKLENNTGFANIFAKKEEK